MHGCLFNVKRLKHCWLQPQMPHSMEHRLAVGFLHLLSLHLSLCSRRCLTSRPLILEVAVVVVQSQTGQDGPASLSHSWTGSPESFSLCASVFVSPCAACLPLIASRSYSQTAQSESKYRSGHTHRTPHGMSLQGTSLDRRNRAVRHWCTHFHSHGLDCSWGTTRTPTTKIHPQQQHISLQKRDRRGEKRMGDIINIKQTAAIRNWLAPSYFILTLTYVHAHNTGRWTHNDLPSVHSNGQGFTFTSCMHTNTRTAAVPLHASLSTLPKGSCVIELAYSII